MSDPTPDIDKLTVEERLMLLERIWDSLSSDPDRVPLTEAQREELDRRLDELDRGEGEGIPWDSFVRQLRARPK
jgi:putative addiction module component (TIGR02574 family)